MKIKDYLIEQYLKEFPQELADDSTGDIHKLWNVVQVKLFGGKEKVVENFSKFIKFTEEFSKKNNNKFVKIIQSGEKFDWANTADVEKLAGRLS